MLKIALIGIVFFHPKEMLFNTYTYTLNKILIVTSAPSSLQLILLKFETVRSVRALLSVKAPWWWCESLYLLLQNIQLGIRRAMSWNHVSGTVPPLLVVTDIIQLSSFSPHNVKKKVISLKNCPCLFHHRFSSYPSLSCMRAQLCPTLCDPMDCSPSGSSVHGIFQARILHWLAISFSRGSSWPRDQTHVSGIFCISRQILYHCATREVPSFPRSIKIVRRRPQLSKCTLTLFLTSGHQNKWEFSSPGPGIWKFGKYKFAAQLLFLLHDAPLHNSALIFASTSSSLCKAAQMTLSWLLSWILHLAVYPFPHPDGVHIPYFSRLSCNGPFMSSSPNIGCNLARHLLPILCHTPRSLILITLGWVSHLAGCLPHNSLYPTLNSIFS